MQTVSMQMEAVLETMEELSSDELPGQLGSRARNHGGMQPRGWPLHQRVQADELGAHTWSDEQSSQGGARLLHGAGGSKRWRPVRHAA
jgi:hypothetical protein